MKVSQKSWTQNWCMIVVQRPNALFVSASFMSEVAMFNLCRIHLSASDSWPVFVAVALGTNSVPNDRKVYFAAWYILLQNLRQANMTLMSKSTSVTVTCQHQLRVTA